LDVPVTETVKETRWGFEEGDEIVPGRYALDKLGGGYQYEAYLAWDDHLFSLVVVKLVRPHLVEDEHALRTLAREGEVLEGLDHPVIVRSFGAVLEGPRPHIVLEHLEGNTLSHAIKKMGPLAPDQLLPLAYQICSALQYLANMEMVHLDVKPRNVVMTAPPRLIDLSVARSVQAAAQMTSPVGTDAYMAPEQCDPSRAVVGPAADVFGLGATLYHAVSGDVPFPRPDGHDPGDPLQRFPQLLEPPFPLPDDLSPGMARLVMRCLEADPSARPTPGELAGELDALIQELPRRRILGRARPKIF
jgi:serine/threonine-protein kinase